MRELELGELHHTVRCVHTIGPQAMKYRRNKARVSCANIASYKHNGKFYCKRHAEVISLVLMVGKEPIENFGGSDKPTEEGGSPLHK